MSQSKNILNHIDIVSMKTIARLKKHVTKTLLLCRNGTYWHIKTLPDRDFHPGNAADFLLSEASKIVHNTFEDQSEL